MIWIKGTRNKFEKINHNILLVLWTKEQKHNEKQKDGIKEPTSIKIKEKQIKGKLHSQSKHNNN